MFVLMNILCHAVISYCHPYPLISTCYYTLGKVDTHCLWIKLEQIVGRIKPELFKIYYVMLAYELKIHTVNIIIYINKVQ